MKPIHLKTVLAFLATLVALVSIGGAIYLAAAGHGTESLVVGVGGGGVTGGLFWLFDRMSK